MNAGKPHRAGFVALGGRSNVGKSTLINRLVGRKVAIVTPRPQTTRRRILGVRTDRDAQMLLIDMPGLHRPRRLLNDRMVNLARRCLAEGEVVVGLIDGSAGRLLPEDASVLAELSALKRPLIVAINKIDLIARMNLIPVAEQCQRAAPTAEIVPISALSGENVDHLVGTIKQRLPESPPLMDPDEYTDQSERTLVEELIREKVFVAMRQEVPFSTAVTIEKFEEDQSRELIRISALIIVEREAHKGMVIGAGGRQLKEIGAAARVELEELLGARVFLGLTVKVEKDWTTNPRRLVELGL